MRIMRYANYLTNSTWRPIYTTFIVMMQILLNKS